MTENLYAQPKSSSLNGMSRPLLFGSPAAVAFLLFAFIVGFIAAILKRGA